MDEQLEIILTGSDREAAWAPMLLERLALAARATRERTGLPLSGPLRVVTHESLWQLRRYLGSSLSHVVAVARPRQREIVLLRSVLFSQGQPDQMRTLVHELTHLAIGWNLARPLPAWLEEGLCMMVAGQAGARYDLRVTAAGALGGILPLARLEDSLLMGGDLQSLAYAQSLSVTRFYLRRTLEGQDSPAALLALLADPARGPGMIELLWDPFYRDALEAQWRSSYRTIWNWLALLSGAGLLWALMSLLFLAAWWRKRRMSRLKLERFAAQEAMDAEWGMNSHLPQPESDDDDEPWEEDER